jgi:CHASE2 domain-containing sensor protein/signal transduction histidine kinase
MTQRRRVLVEWLCVLLLAGGLGCAAALGGWLWRLDLGLQDWAQQHIQRQANADVLIVAIDDKSLAELGRWPWPRNLHAALIDKLSAAGARAVALDLMFAESEEQDALLAAAMLRNGHVVLPVFQQQHDEQISGEMRPVAVLEHAAAALGHIQVELDPDGIARSVYLYEGWQGALHPQLALALWQLAGGRASTVLPPAGQGWQRAGWLRIPFVGPPGSFAQVSYADVLSGRVPPAQLADKLVLVGATALGLSDTVPVPTAALHRQMPGVEVHANVLTALAQDSGIAQAGTAWQAVLSAVSSLLLLLVLARSSARVGLLATVATCLALLVSSFLLLRLWPLWLGPTPALLACFIAYPLWSWRRLEATQRYLDRELLVLRDSVALPASGGVDPLQQRLEIVRQATQASQEARRLVEDLLAHLPVGVIVLQTQGTLRYANDKALALFEASDYESLIRKLRQLRWPPAIHTAASTPVPPAAPQQAEVLLPSSTAALASLSALQDKQGQPTGLVIGLADLSELRAAQQARDDTLRFVSHDLRAPLASLLSLIDEPAEDAAWLPRLRRHAQSALQLADELFRLSRIEAADPARFMIVDLQAICAEACDELWAHARDGNNALQLNASDEEYLVLGSSELLRRALINLISNAIKYGAPGQPVEISFTRVASCWEIAVRDHGPGIAEAERKLLFRRFGRLPAASARGIAGQGLGLVMVRTVAEKHGGSVRHEAAAGGGSCFILSLPAREAAEHEAAGPA